MMTFDEHVKAFRLHRFAEIIAAGGEIYAHSDMVDELLAALPAHVHNGCSLNCAFVFALGTRVHKSGVIPYGTLVAVVKPMPFDGIFGSIPKLVPRGAA